LYGDIISQGMQQGLQQGLQRGRMEELQSVLLRQLTRRVGKKLSKKTREAVAGLSLEQAENLAEDLLDFTGPADLAQWLRRRTLN
jgi:predicted transposase YdaD